MRKYIFIIYILVACVFPANAQLFNAGPDQTICSGAGADLGTNAVIPSTWCITWSPVDGLDDIHSARPHATPKQTTKYVATVLTDSWESLSTDEVNVIVGFGGIKFNPPYLNQGSQLTSLATLTINPNNDQVTWSFDGDSKGCMINPSTGVITPGSLYGTITIKATKTQHPACFATETIDINEGTKDVEARDFAHPGRVAKGGVDKLYLVGESEAVITAIPNATGFNSGQPMWYYDGSPETQVPSTGQNEIVTPPFAGDGVVKYIAGSMAGGYQPNVSVEHLSSNELIIDLGAVLLNFQDRFKKINDFLKEKIAKKYPAIPNLSVEVNLASMKYKKNKAEKYNSPDWDYKYTFEAGGSAKLSGKLYHPQFTGSIDLNLIGVSLGSELYIEPFFESSFTGAVIKDPSKADPGWYFVNPIKASVTGGVRGAFNVYGTGAGYKVTGGFSLGSKITTDLTYTLQTGELKIKFTLSPLMGNTKIVFEKQTDPKKKYTFFDYTVDLLDKWSSDNFTIYTFGQ